MAGKDQEQGWHALGGGAHGSGNQLRSMWFFGVELEPVETASRVASGKQIQVRAKEAFLIQAVLRAGKPHPGRDLSTDGVILC